MTINKFLFFGIIVLFFHTLAYSKITKGPYLTDPGQTSMTISWESDMSEKAVLKYGASNCLGNSLLVKSLDQRENLFLYSVKIEDLDPGMKYYYQVVMSDSTCAMSYFTTAPTEDASINFVAIGDSRTGHEVHQKISELIANISPDMVISMGDLVGAGGRFYEWGPHFFQPAADMIDHIPLISTVGDHDTRFDDAENFNYYFRFTEEYQKIWFSYDYGPAHFVSLDYRAYKDSAMIEWFEKDMAQSNAKWTFVYLHRPSYNVGGHRTNWGAGIWPELYRKHKVDIVFTGHSHLYERFLPMKPTNDPDAWPVTYITTGGAGASLYESIEHENLAVTESVNHLLSIQLSEDSLKLIAYRADMSLLDQFEIVKNNDGQYNSEYLDLVKPQELMDTYMIFANRLLKIFDQLPSENTAAEQSISFKSIAVDEDIIFKVILSEQSSEYYSIEPISGVLKKGETFNGIVKLYSKKPYQIDDVYFDPPVKMNVSFEMKNLSGIAIGRQSRYYPPAEE